MKTPKPRSELTKEELVAHLKEIYAADDYFTGVLGNRNSFFHRQARSPQESYGQDKGNYDGLSANL
jgi:hypothetical protein